MPKRPQWTNTFTSLYNPAFTLIETFMPSEILHCLFYCSQCCNVMDSYNLLPNFPANTRGEIESKLKTRTPKVIPKLLTHIYLNITSVIKQLNNISRKKRVVDNKQKMFLVNSFQRLLFRIVTSQIDTGILIKPLTFMVRLKTHTFTSSS